MSEAVLAEIIQQRLPRLIVSGVDYNDAQLLMKRMTRAEDWCPEWVRMAEEHEARGEDALRSRHLVTAGQAFRRAAIYYHTGQCVYFEDLERKFEIQRRQQAAYRKAMPFLSPPAEPIEIPFEGIVFVGNLRLPFGVSRPPCVLLNPGADSTKEEFSTLEEEFLKRGLATFSYDGPGQGMTWRHMKLRPDIEKPVGAILDVLGVRNDIDPARIGIWGRSLGGYAAPRAAAFERRLKACISIGGFYDMAEIWERFPQTTKDPLRFGLGAQTDSTARELARGFSLAGVLKHLKCPLLIVHSGMDTVCPVTDSERVRREAGGKTWLKVFPEGNHVCDNIPYQVRPLMADWMAQQLSG